MKGEGRKRGKKGTKAQERFDHDGWWKDVIERFWPYFLQRALPELYEDADMDRKPEFWCQELRDILNPPDAIEHQAARFVDELIKVPMKDGKDRWVLLHIEIQGPGGETFSLRMVVYCCLIFAHFNEMPVALAILTSPRPREEREAVGFYESSQYGTRLTYRYNCLELYKLDEAELLASDNPFDLALYAAKKAMTCRNQEERKFQYLRDLTWLLADRGWDNVRRRDMLSFIARVINLKDRTLRKQFALEVKERNKKMGKLTFIEKYFQDEGIVIGEKKGIAIGKKQGIAIGEKRGEQRGRQEERRLLSEKLIAAGWTPQDAANFVGL